MTPRQTYLHQYREITFCCFMHENVQYFYMYFGEKQTYLISKDTSAITLFM